MGARRRCNPIAAGSSCGGKTVGKDRSRVLRASGVRSALSGTTIGGAVLVAALLCLLGPVASASAVSGTDPITTIAGTGTSGFGGDGFSATKSLLRLPVGVAVDRSGNVYVADTRDNRVRKVDTSGIITTVAGNGSGSYSGDGGPATKAGIGAPDGVAVDNAGNIYISSYQVHRVRKVDAATGVITTVAGNGTYGYSGDGGPATQASVSPGGSVALDGAGNIYIPDSDLHIRKVDAATGIITTVAGNGTDPFACDNTEGVPATQTSVEPNGLAVDAAGNIYVAEFLCARVRKIDPSGIITTFAGTGGFGAYGGDGGPATQAQLNTPADVSVDSQGNVYIADLSNARVRKVDTSGIITTVAGNGTQSSGGDFGPANQASLDPWGVAVDSAGSLYIADGNSRMRRVGPDRLFLAESHAPDPAIQGDRITHTFTVYNLAGSASTGVKLTDTLDPNEAYVANNRGCKVAGRTVTCTVGSIASGASAAVQITVQALHPGALTNRATVTANEPDPYPPTNILVVPTLVSAPGCGQTITRNTVLGTDLGPCAQNGVVIGADNVTLDLKGHRIYGFPGPSGPAGNAVGVLLTGRTGVTVKNGTVTEFDGGVVVLNGSSNTIKNLTLKDNIGPDDPFNSLYGDGIFIDNSPGNQVMNNIISHNGIFDGIGIYDPLSNNNVIQNNVITNTVGPLDTGPSGQGIIINGATGNAASTFIQGTQVSNNVVSGNASAGIANINEVKGSIVGNTVTGNGTTNSIGNGIGVSVGFNWNLGPTQLLIQNNQIHGNGVDGIRIGNPFGFGTGSPDGNQILNNDAANNAANPAADTYEGGIQGYDLHDLNANCGADIWSGNIWGSGGYNPTCTTTGGSPAPAAPSAATTNAATSPEARLWKKQNAKAWQQFTNQGRR